jgi:hypothetical protein
MRIRRQSTTRAEFLAIVRQCLFAEPSLEQRAGVDAWRGVRLRQDQITGLPRDAGPKDMIEANFQHGCAGRIRRDVATHPEMTIRRLQNHRHGVPSIDVFDALFDLDITGIHRLFLGWNGVDVRRVQRRTLQRDAQPAGFGVQAGEQFLHPLCPPFPGDIAQGHSPLLNILLDLLHALRFH